MCEPFFSQGRRGHKFWSHSILNAFDRTMAIESTKAQKSLKLARYSIVASLSADYTYIDPRVFDGPDLIRLLSPPESTRSPCATGVFFLLASDFVQHSLLCVQKVQ